MNSGSLADYLSAKELYLELDVLDMRGELSLSIPVLVPKSSGLLRWGEGRMKRRCFVIGIHKETIPITAGTATQCCSVILTHSVTTRCGVGTRAA